MPLYYRKNILDALKDAGYSTYRIRQEKIFGEATLQKFRDGEPVSWDNISLLCKLLKCQPGDILANYNLYAIDMDYCPLNDAILMRQQCSGCQYYKGFEICNDLPCVKCSYYHEIDDTQVEK